MKSLAESEVEEIALAWFSGLGYATLFGPSILPGEMLSERTRLDEGFLRNRLRSALAKLNPHLPAEAIEDAFRKVTMAGSPHLMVNNRTFHTMLVEGVDVEITRDGRRMGDKACLADFEDAEANDFLVVSQFTVVEQGHNRRADLVVFLNGLPVGVIELKNPADENATIWNAYQQLQTYKQEIPALFAFNEVLVISDGLEARLGTLTSPQERFMPWRTITGTDLCPPRSPSPRPVGHPSPNGRGEGGEGFGLKPELQMLVHGVFEKRRFLDLLRHFIVFEDEGKGGVAKKLAGYHQFHAVNAAIRETLRAIGGDVGTAPSPRPSPSGRGGGGEGHADGRIGVIWHTQGSGKSLTMVFYAGKLILAPELENPTLVVLTDRNDLKIAGVTSCFLAMVNRPLVKSAGEERGQVQFLSIRWPRVTMGFRGQRPGIEGGDGLPDFAAVGVKTLDIYTAVFRPPAHRAASRTALMNKLVAAPKISPFSLTSPPHWIARSIADGMVMNEQGV